MLAGKDGRFTAQNVNTLGYQFILIASSGPITRIAAASDAEGSGVWVSPPKDDIDVKDAYFHVPIALHHSQYLCFVFEGKAYQFKVLLFVVSLVPQDFTWCIHANIQPGNRLSRILWTSQRVVFIELDCLLCAFPPQTPVSCSKGGNCFWSGVDFTKWYLVLRPPGLHHAPLHTTFFQGQYRCSLCSGIGGLSGTLRLFSARWVSLWLCW